jgi:hypothetical protein
MKLTAHTSVNFPLLPVGKSFSQINTWFSKVYRIGINTKPCEIAKNCTWEYNYNMKSGCKVTITGNKQTNPEGYISYSTIKIVKNVTAEKSLFIYPLSGTDYKNNNLALLNAGRNILFSTTLSKASVELPSLATGFTLSG